MWSLADSHSRLKRSVWLTSCSYIDRQACSSLHTAVVALGLQRLHPGDSCPAKREVLPPVWPQREGPASLEGPYLGHLCHMGPVQMTGWHSALISFPFIERHVTACWHLDLKKPNWETKAGFSCPALKRVEKVRLWFLSFLVNLY